MVLCLAHKNLCFLDKLWQNHTDPMAKADRAYNELETHHPKGYRW